MSESSPIPQPCGGPGQPACPPIECIAHVNGILTAVIDGKRFTLVEGAAGLDTVAAPVTENDPAAEIVDTVQD